MAAKTSLNYAKIFAGIKPSGDIIYLAQICDAIVGAIRTVAARPEFNCLARLEAVRKDGAKSGFIYNVVSGMREVLVKHGSGLLKLGLYKFVPIDKGDKAQQFQFYRAAVAKLIDVVIDSDNCSWALGKYKGLAKAIKLEAKKTLGCAKGQIAAPKAAAAAPPAKELSLYDELLQTQVITAIGMISTFIENIQDLLPSVKSIASLATHNLTAKRHLEPVAIRKIGYIVPTAKTRFLYNSTIGITTEEYAKLDKAELCIAIRAIVNAVVITLGASQEVKLKEGHDGIKKMPELEEMLKIQAKLLEAMPEKRRQEQRGAAGGGLVTGGGHRLG